MTLALPHATGETWTLTPVIIRQGFDAAAASPRRRIILPLHRSPEAIVQRMLNFLLPGTYIRPHLHPLPFATETIQVLRGELIFYLFNDQGQITQRHHLRAEEGGLIDIEPNLWHGFIVPTGETLILEIKRGPYDGQRDKVFAPWAPEEGSAAVTAYLDRLTCER
jgi:cupin fold WbuC family metalloprotein